MDAYLVSLVPSAKVDRLVERLEQRGSSYLGPQYRTSVRRVVEGSVSTVVTVARNSHNPLPECVFDDGRTLFVFSGYLVDPVTDLPTLRSWFGPLDRDSRPILRSPGGLYSYVTVRRRDGQLCAGHSTPTLEPVYVAETADGLHVGNNPLLVHVASTGRDRPDLDESFFLAAVNAGVAIDGSTPFGGCRRVPPRSVLVSVPGTWRTRVLAAPRPSCGRYRLSSTRRRRDAVSSALLRAGSVLTALPMGEFRVSGGKDSRLLAASLSWAGIAATPVNQNHASEVEGQVADRVAAVLGSASCVRYWRERPIGPDDVARETRRKIAYAGGLPTVASLQYVNRVEAATPGIPLVMGHAHLQRGGLRARPRTAEAAIETASSRTVSPYLRAPFTEESARVARDLVDEVLAGGGTPESTSFHAYLQLTLNHQFQPLYAYVRNWNPHITPMVDERFALLCEDITSSRSLPVPRRRSDGMSDLRSERLAMEVTGLLEPSLLDFPLAGDRYRCDGPDRAGYELRDPDLVRPRPIPAEDVPVFFDTRRTPATVRAQLWEQIEGTVVQEWGEVICRPEIWRYVSEPATGVPDGENRVLLNQFAWRLYGLAVVLATDWWEELAAPPGR